MRHLLLETWWDLRRNPGPSILSFLSLSVAVLAVIGIQTTAAIGSDIMVARSEQVSGRAVTYSATLPAMTWTATMQNRTRNEIGAAMSAPTSRWALTLQSASPTPIATLSDTASAQPCTLYLTDGDLAAVRRLPVLAGAIPDQSTVAGGVVLNQAAHDQFGDAGQSVVLTLDPRYPPIARTIAGVIADGNPAPDAYYPLASALFAAPAAASGSTAQLFVTDPNLAPSAVSAETAAAMTNLGMDPRNTQPTRADASADLSGQIRMISLAFTAVSLIAILVAIVGMINIGLAGIRERTHELTIRRSIGATPGRLIAVILITMLLVGITACVVSTAIAWVVVRVAVPQFLTPADALQPPAFPWSAAVAGAAIGLASSLIAAILPALRTRRLELAAVLRA